ncbi:MAG: hypothetical protein K2N95_16100 [Lachnospiraceae bacterium]|nr:hypothetical protein [Lachnospiraceae bacterium]
MSMIGDFGICTKNSYNRLAEAIRNDQLDAVEELTGKLCSELENSMELMENHQCSGEVFLALFQYFKTEFGIDIYGDEERKKLNEEWREITGDYDMIVFTETEKTQFLSLADRIDYDKLAQFMNDFFQDDYGNAGQAACSVFLENLRKMKPDDVLLWHLY